MAPSETDEIVNQPGIDPAALQAGLAVYYRHGFWRHVDQMPSIKGFVEKGERGGPITLINHRFGQGEVFDSGRSRGIGVQMMGFIHLDEAGTWRFQVHANDGIEVTIGETKVVDDPGWHSDRYSEPMEFHAEKAGWFPLLLRYFQRKGTATLEFYWQAPGEEGFTIVPPSAYGHLPDPS
jgi:hypothetical protein